MADSTFIKNKLQELIASNPGVNEITFGKKIISGSVTDEDSFIFGVTQKKPLAELSESEIIPTTIASGSDNIKTDVVEVSQIVTLGSLDFITTARTVAEKVVTVAVSVENVSGSDFIRIQASENEVFTEDELDKIVEQALNGGRKLGVREGEEVSIMVTIPAECPDCYSTPIAQQSSVRPLRGGIQIGASEKGGAVGTLGFLGIDNATGALVGVTNVHVTSNNMFKVTQVNPIYDSLNQGAGLAPYHHTARGQSNNIGQPTQGSVLGPFLRFVPLNILGFGTNTVDGAIFAVAPSDINESESFKQYGLSWTSPLTFASTAEIDSIISTTELYSSGRTTGPKEGDCGLRAASTSVSINVSGYVDSSIGGYTRVVSFTDIIKFTRINTVCPYPINAGDSGSALIANFSGTWKIIGLCFAGNDFNGYACRIDNVASQLGISAWDGLTPEYIDPSSKKTYTVTGRQSAETVTHNGQTYYVIGTSITDGSEN